ncbi:MAG: SDR family oxidoreductase [Alphaproteobacteria bacterium]
MPLTDYTSALVTGASSGIGLAVAQRLLGRGLTVHAVARRRDRLEALSAPGNCVIHAVDVRDGGAVAAAFGALEIDILVNAAGVGQKRVGLHELSPGQIDDVLETNVLGATRVLRAVLPGMVRRRRGHVVNIGSITGLHATPGSVYGASKAAIHMLSQDLRLEVQGTGIRVSEICPGGTRTEFHALARDLAQDEIDRTMYSYDVLTPADVTDAIVYVLDAPARVDVTLMELMATEQVPGGNAMVRREPPPE